MGLAPRTTGAPRGVTQNENEGPPLPSWSASLELSIEQLREVHWFPLSATAASPSAIALVWAGLRPRQGASLLAVSGSAGIGWPLRRHPATVAMDFTDIIPTVPPAVPKPIQVFALTSTRRPTAGKRTPPKICCPSSPLPGQFAGDPDGAVMFRHTPASPRDKDVANPEPSASWIVVIAHCPTR
jgi:hypothetical protein